MGYGDKEECCASLLSQVLDGIASSRDAQKGPRLPSGRARPPRRAASTCGAQGGRGGSAGAREGAAAAVNRHQGGNHGSVADHATEARRESHGGAER